MPSEATLVALLGAGALAWLCAGIPNRRRRRRARIGCAVAFAACVAASLRLEPPRSESDVDDRPIRVADDGYVSSDGCRACHPSQYASWYASWHRTMTQVATPGAVQGSFDGREIEAWGRRYRLERRDDAFWVELDASDSDEPPRKTWRRIVLTTGSHHQQDYWYATGEGRRLGFLPLMFLLEERRWIPFSAAFLMPPVESPPSAEQLDRWHTTCVKCHATHGKPRTTGSEPHPESVDTHVAEFGIACEACHGPGARHVEANRDPLHRYGLHLGKDDDTSIVDPRRLSAERASQVCGQCHGIHRPRSFLPRATRLEDDWRDHGLAFRPGDDLEASRYLVRAERRGEQRMEELRFANPHFLEDRFWSDGAVRVSGREYNGLVASACFQRGRGERQLSCLSCHAMHRSEDDPRSLAAWADDQLAPGKEGDGACLGCHPQFAGEEALGSHTHHPGDSSGSRCANCHMPHTTWGLLKAIRSHTIASPSIAESRDTGRPNACVLCHLDRTAGWAGRFLTQWYGQPKETLPVALARVPASIVWALGGDAGQRALVAWAMGWEPALDTSQRGQGWTAEFLALLLDDPYDAVRYTAARSLRRQPGFADFEYDFMGPPAARRDAVARATTEWRAGRIAAGEPDRGAFLLDDREGELPDRIFEAIYRQRSDARVWLKE